jgi:hydrogenase expression/formation protein HypC
MCLAIPGKLLDIDQHSSPLMGTVSFGGVRKKVCLELLPEVEPGEYVIVHVGFAISKLDEREAMETFSVLDKAFGTHEILDEYRNGGAARRSSTFLQTTASSQESPTNRLTLNH